MNVPGAVKQRPATRVPSAWPAIVALVLVVTIALVMFAWNMYSTHRTTSASAHVVENSLRSVELVNDLRYEVARAEAVGSAREREEAERRIAELVQAYAPLATTTGETTELVRLRGMLGRGLPDDPASAPGAVHFARVQMSLEQLVHINERAAQRLMAEIRRTNDATLIGQSIAAIVVLVAASVIASLLYRVLDRQNSRVQEELVALAARNQDLSTFVGRTAHDLRGPLAPIYGYAELLLAGSSDVAKAAKRIRSSAQRMAEILDHLAMLSTTGKLPAGEAEVGAVVRELLAELGDDLAGAQTTVRIEDNCRAACTPGVLRQILHNVITNSCKYRSPDRTLNLVIEGRYEADRVFIVIEDNGIGIAPEGVSRAFEAGYRAPSVCDSHGSGLGLSIVKRMVEVLGGTCKLTSELGRGTRFEMRLAAAPPATHLRSRA